MRIVLDANIVIMGLMGSRSVITILTGQNHKFYVPKKIFSEIRKYERIICERTKQNSEEFTLNFEALSAFVTETDEKDYDPFLEKARTLLKNRDLTDVEYVACALAVNADFIWTNDKDFSVQTLVKTRNTQEFIQDFKK